MQTLEDYGKFMEAVRKETGIETLKPDESGLVSVRIDDTYNMHLQFVEATCKILCFVEVAELQADAPKSVYRDLLAGGLFGRDTAGGYFALEEETETVVYNYYYDFDKVLNEDIEEFVESIEKILQLCDMWANRIKNAVDEVGVTPDVGVGHGSGDSMMMV